MSVNVCKHKWCTYFGRILVKGGWGEIPPPTPPGIAEGTALTRLFYTCLKTNFLSLIGVEFLRPLQEHQG